MWGWLTTCREIKVTCRFIFIKARNHPNMTEIFERAERRKKGERFKELFRMSFDILRCRCAYRTLRNAIKCTRETSHVNNIKNATENCLVN
jgi:hypothetical protein